MSPEERQLITGLFDRISSAANAPRDPEAEALIADAVKAMPYAPYFLVQAVIVQDQALRAANERLQQLEARLNDLDQQGQGQRPGSGGFLSGLGSIFGGGAPAQQTPPSQPRGPWGPPASQQQSYPPQPEPGPWGGAPPAGGGFLQGALGTAAGVAGGVLLADSIRNLFGGHGGLGIGSGFGGLGGLVGGETIVNNYNDGTPGADDTTVIDDYDDTDNGDSGGDDGTYNV
jgi:hypothetical protein